MAVLASSAFKTQANLMISGRVPTTVSTFSFFNFYSFKVWLFGLLLDLSRFSLPITIGTKGYGIFFLFYFISTTSFMSKMLKNFIFPLASEKVAPSIDVVCAIYKFSLIYSKFNSVSFSSPWVNCSVLWEW